jgi:hypothetical protein
VSVPVRRVEWNECWRIIPTRYPEERLFDRVTYPGDREAVAQLEKQTNERLRQGMTGSPYIMAPFTYRNPVGSRFSDGSFGVYYTSDALETVVAESRFHRERFLRRTKEPPMQLQMRALKASLSAELHDLGGMAKRFPKAYSRAGYAASQEMAAKLRKQGSEGIAYDSLRREGGQCAAVFVPSTLSACRPERQLIYQWDGKEISTTFELREIPKK